jgi:hypothetical protein
MVVLISMDWTGHMHNAVKIPLYLYVLYYLNTELKIRDFVNFYYSHAEGGPGVGVGGEAGCVNCMFTEPRKDHPSQAMFHLVRPLVAE